MTSRDANGPLQIQFSIDDRPGVVRPADISAALGLRIPPRNAEGYRDWAHPPHREMVRALARDATAVPSSAYQLVPSAALCAEEGTHPRGTIPDLGQILVQSIRAGDDFIIAVRGEGPSEGPDKRGEHPTTDAETALLCSRADGIPRGAQTRDESSMPACSISGPGDDYARLIPYTPVGPGGGTGSGG